MVFIKIYAAAIRRKWAGKEERRSTGCTYLIGLLLDVKNGHIQHDQADRPARARRRARARPETAPKARMSTKAAAFILSSKGMVTDEPGYSYSWLCITILSSPQTDSSSQD